MTTLDRIAQFVTETPWGAIPTSTVSAAKVAILDSMGTMLAGVRTATARSLLRVAENDGGAGACVVFGTGLRTTATWAGLCNGTLGHALDFDDTNLVMLGHASVPLCAAAFACAELVSGSGQDVIHAFLLGYEVESALGRFLQPQHYLEGWHPTCTIGTLGATVTAAKLLGLDAAQIRNAMGLAASQASGLRANFGSMTKPFHAGHAARSGILSALLAKEGFTSSPHAFDGKNGFIHLFKSQHPDPRPMFETLGSRWEIVETPSAVKQYPSAAPTHSFMDGLRELKKTHSFRPEEVVAVTIGLSSLVPEILPYSRPESGLQGKFSIEYCAALAILDDHIGLSSFTDERVGRPDVQAMIRKVSVRVDEAIPSDVDSRFRSRVQVSLSNGTALERPPNALKGSHSAPLPIETIYAKFLDCAKEVLSHDAADALGKRLLSLEDSGRAAETTRLTVPTGNAR